MTKPIFLRTRASKVAHESPKCCSQQLFSWLGKKKTETIPSLSSNRHRKASPRRVGFSLSVSSWARVLAPAFRHLHPGPRLFSPPSQTPKGRRGLAEGAARDPERKGPSLGPNAGGVSLDRRRLGTTAGTGDKVTYQSRFGARADTPLPTGNAELFKRPYRLLYLSRRKASRRETKDVPYLEIQGCSPPHTRGRSAQATPSEGAGTHGPGACAKSGSGRPERTGEQGGRHRIVCCTL